MAIAAACNTDFNTDFNTHANADCIASGLTQT